MGEGQQKMCWLAAYVTAATQMDMKKVFSSAWKLSCKFCEKGLSYPPTWPPCHVVANHQLAGAVLKLRFAQPRLHNLLPVSLRGEDPGNEVGGLLNLYFVFLKRPTRYAI